MRDIILYNLTHTVFLLVFSHFDYSFHAAALSSHPVTQFIELLMHDYVLCTIVIDYMCTLPLVAFSESKHADA